MSLESAIATVSLNLLAHYTTPSQPSLLELVALAVQHVEILPLTGQQKMTVVQEAVRSVIAQLLTTDEHRLRLQQASLLIAETAENALALIKTNQLLAQELGRSLGACLLACFGQASVKKQTKVPFPLLR
jgi:hypothetical protein